MIMGPFGTVTHPCPASSEIPNHPTLRQRKLATLIASCTFTSLVAWPLACQAVGLGASSGDAVIGEPLHLSVPLTGTIDQPLDDACISVLRPTDPIDPTFFPRDLAAHINRALGTPRIVLTSRTAVRQPLVEFRLSVGCGYNLSHDYVLMASPRAEASPKAAAATSTSPAIARQSSGNSATPISVSKVAPFVAAPTVAGERHLPDGIAGKDIVLDRDMTLEQLARKHFPGPLRQQRFMRWVAEANPQLFAGAGNLRKHRLANGTSLTIPKGVPPRRAGDHQGPLNPLGEPINRASNGDAAPIAAAPPPRAKGATREGTTTASDGRQDRLVLGGGGSVRSMKEAVAIVDQLTSMMEKQLATQTAYNEKIKQLETSVEELNKQLKGLEADAAKREQVLQAARQAEKTAREQETEREWWSLLATVFAGGLAGAGALLGLQSLLGRRRSIAEDVDDLPIEEITPAAPSKPARQEPLTEFGWEDAPDHPSPAQSLAPHVDADDSQSPAGAQTTIEQAHSTTHQPIEFAPPEDVAFTDTVSSDPATAAIELANIMASMGLAESAAQTLVEHIRENPRESLPQWLKLLEIHRLNGNRDDFELSATELRQHFNVQADDWSSNPASGRTSLESYQHIRAQIVKLWPTQDCATLLRALLLDNREGTRVGFPLAVAEEILLLIAMLNSRK